MSERALSLPGPGDWLAGTPYWPIGVPGQGGTGEVLEAEHRSLNKRGVVKRVRLERDGSAPCRTGLFVARTVASTLLFSARAVLVCRWLEGR
jgi:hypothetical protein